MTDDSQATTDTNADAEPVVPETTTAVAETSTQKPEMKKAGRGARSAQAAKAPKPAKSARGREVGKSEETVAPKRDEAAETVGKAAKPRRLARTTKPAKPAPRGKVVEAAKVAASTRTSKRAKPEKTIEAAKPAKAAKPSRKAGKTAPAAAPVRPATIAAGGGKGARYTTNELNSAAKKAGLTVEFTPVVTKAANIGRGPAKEFKVDAIIAHLLGSNGEPIRDRGPGTPLYNDAESLAAVAIFDKFRGRTFHNKLKVEIL